VVVDPLTLPPKNVPLAECFNASKEIVAASSEDGVVLKFLVV